MGSSDMGNRPPLQQLLLPAPPAPNGPANPSAKMDPHIDLLSGEELLTPQTDRPLALVPVIQPSTCPSPQENALALVDTFSQSNDTSSPHSLDSHTVNPAAQPLPSTPQFQHQQQKQLLQPQQLTVYSNGSAQNTVLSQYEQAPCVQGGAHLNHESDSSWNGTQSLGTQQQAHTYGANGQSNRALPPPPWEAQPMQASNQGSENLQSMQSMLPPHSMQSDHLGILQPPSMQSSQLGMMISQPMQTAPVYTQQLLQGSSSGGMYIQQMQSRSPGGMYHQQTQSDMYPQQMQYSSLGGMYPQQMQSGQLTSVYPQMLQTNWQQVSAYPHSMQGATQMSIYPQPLQGAQLPGYPYGPFIEQRMNGLSMQDDSSRFMNSSYQTSTSSYLQAKKPAKPEDKLFGDLVDIAKSMPTKRNPSKVGSLSS